VLLVLLCCSALAEDLVSAPRLLADVETTPLPAGDITVASLTETIFLSLKKVLDNPQYQWADVAVAIIFGLILVLDGEFVFRWLVVAAVGLLGALLALSEVSTDLGIAYQGTLRHLVAFEVGLGCAFAAWKGIDGVMLTAFAMIGAFVAFKTKDIVLLIENYAGSNPWFVVVWYSFWTLLGMGIMHRRKHIGVLTIVAPLFGAALISASISWMLTTAALKGHLDFLKIALVPQLQPAEKGTWIEFLLFLVDPSNKDVGVFAHTSFATHPSMSWMHGKWCFDRVLGLVFGFIIFLIGFSIQRRAVKLQQIEARKQRGNGKVNVQSLARPKQPSLNAPELNESLLAEDAA